MQMTCPPALDGSHTVPRGLEIETEPVRGEPCRFRTTADATLWPVVIENVRLSGLPLAAPANPRTPGAKAVLRITLRCAEPERTFSDLALDRLRFFLRGSASVTMPLYEMLCCGTLGVAFADGPNDPAPVLAPAEMLTPAGFAPEEALIPWPARSFAGFRLLTEYFAIPEKFLFLDLDGFHAKTLVNAGNRLDVFLYLDRAAPELERVVNADSLALGCAPVVNLFRHACEPIALTQTQTEYRIVPDQRRPHALEVWQVARVQEARPDGSTARWAPFHRLSHGEAAASAPVAFYNVVRRPALGPLSGTEAFLAPHRPGFDPAAPEAPVLSVDAICLNRDLPKDLPFGGGLPRLRLEGASAAVAEARFVMPATPTLRPRLREAGAWRLISHLSLGHLSVVGGEDGAAALREVLRLYDLRDTAETRAAIDSLVGVSSAPGTARVPGGRSGAFCRGVDVTLEFDPRGWAVGGLYLLSAVLERFLALHANINAFARSRVMLRGRPGTVARFPPRAGSQTLL
jgi:type VI secretion system protein ImpG